MPSMRNKVYLKRILVVMKMMIMKMRMRKSGQRPTEVSLLSNCQTEAKQMKTAD